MREVRRLFGRCRQREREQYKGSLFLCNLPEQGGGLSTFWERCGETDSTSGQPVAASQESPPHLVPLRTSIGFRGSNGRTRDGSAVAPVLHIEDFLCFISEFALALALPHEQQVGHYANCAARQRRCSTCRIFSASSMPLRRGVVEVARGHPAGLVASVASGRGRGARVIS
jgi:hypothetical protein